ncbi:MAG: hypothetical protein IJ783_11150 [Kiritimatiellae bacterium]|nr:hypothetical protein [Kiritimatiellia bacterium]
MVTRILLPVLCLAVVCRADTQTNVAAIVGAALDSAEIARFPDRDGSSPDTVFLGTIKALQTGSLANLYCHFETNYLQRCSGYSRWREIPADVSESFASAMQNSGVSNLVVTTYSSATSNRHVRIEATIQETFEQRTISENLILSLEEKTDGWKIVAFDGDNWDD